MRNVPYFLALWASCCLLAGPAFATTLTSQSVQVQPHPKDLIPPTGTVVMNGNAAYTNGLTVTLTLSATDNSGTVAKMKFSPDGITFSSPEPYAISKGWTLSSGEGTKTVYVKFADAAGNWSQPASDAILLDTIPPVVTITSPQDGQTLSAP